MVRKKNVIPIFDYTMEIRRVIYITNAIESLNLFLRKVIKTKVSSQTKLLFADSCI